MEIIETYKEAKEHPLLYIITDSNWVTLDSKWGPSVTHSSEKAKLIACTDPIIATFLQVSQFEAINPVLWGCTGKVKSVLTNKSVACTELTAIRILPSFNISLFTRLKFAFSCISKIYKEKFFVDWMLDWLTDFRKRTQEKANEINEHCNSLIAKESAKEDADYELIYAIYSVMWVSIAAKFFADRENSISEITKLVQYWTGLAATQSSEVAHANKIKFDLSRIAELTMI